jgi:hypothetical protein
MGLEEAQAQRLNELLAESHGIFRVLWLIHHHAATTEEPAVVVWRDKPLLICILLWGLTAGIISVAAGTA